MFICLMFMNYCTLLGAVPRQDILVTVTVLGTTQACVQCFVVFVSTAVDGFKSGMNMLVL